MPALVYMHPDDPNKTPGDHALDWRVMAMSDVIQTMQRTNTGFIPILGPFTQQPERGEEALLVPQLSSMMGIQPDELPNFFLYHHLTGTTTAFPIALDDPRKISPDLILVWARRSQLELETEKFGEEVKKL